MCLSKTMREGVNSGRIWFSSALMCSKAVDAMVYEHLLPKLVPGDFNLKSSQDFTMRLWARDIDEFIEKKVKDKEMYDKLIRRLFRVGIKSTETIIAKSNTVETETAEPETINTN